MSVSQSKLKAVCNARFSDVLPLCIPDDIARKHALEKRQIVNIDAHLLGIGAKIAVIESEYIDRDFIEDYSNYYARCHGSYDRHCSRVHFFDKEFSDDDIKKLLLSGSDEELKDLDKHYCGFVVIRPLRVTIVGRTCLRMVEDRSPGALLAYRNVAVSFFGCPLHVRCMPFQEQDRAVSACATSALWSAFQVTATLFGHCDVSPSRITELATDLGISLGRSLPNNHGLTIEEMLHAIRRVGLDVVCVRLSDPNLPLRKSIILGNVYGYLSAGLPLILVGKLLPDSPMTSAECTMPDMHAMAVCGYGTENGGRLSSQRPHLVAANISDVVVNDDQIGVYEKMQALRSFGQTDFSTKWEKNGQRLGLHVCYLIVPIYHKIRVSYEEVWNALVVFDRLVQTYLRSRLIQWSIVLSLSNDFKKRVRAMSDISDDAKLSILTSSLPKYIWEVRACLNNTENAIFCIDATDAGQGLEVVRLLFRAVDLIDIVASMPSKEYLNDNPIFNACLEAVQVRSLQCA